MCDGCVPFVTPFEDDMPTEKPQDVRATQQYRVAVTLLVDAVDADDAATSVLACLPNGSTIKYIQASEEEAGW